MYELPVIQKSAWDKRRIEKFLESSVIPIRIAVNDKEGFPLICSLWYFYRNNKFYCATSKKSKIYKLLKSDSRCAFEIAPNNPPYKGVRGQANVFIETDSGKTLLQKLINRYLGSIDSKLAKWLLNKKHDELSLEIEPVWICAWDYTGRMND